MESQHAHVLSSLIIKTRLVFEELASINSLRKNSKAFCCIIFYFIRNPCWLIFITVIRFSFCCLFSRHLMSNMNSKIFKMKIATGWIFRIDIFAVVVVRDYGEISKVDDWLEPKDDGQRRCLYLNIIEVKRGDRNQLC